MSRHVYVTSWDSSRVLDEVTCDQLEYSAGPSLHGEAMLETRVVRGSTWRAAAIPGRAGVLIATDGTPDWAGVITSVRQSGPRIFQVTAAEVGALTYRMPCPTVAATGVNDHAIYRDLLTRAQLVPGQDMHVQVPETTGAATSDRTVNPWDNRYLGDELQQIGDAEGGPEWAYHVTGTVDDPRRVLLLADRLGSPDPQHVLEYVLDSPEDDLTGQYTVTALGNLFPAGRPDRIHKRGGNVVAHPARDEMLGWTAARAVGDGSEAEQVRSPDVTAGALLAAGWPRMTHVATYSGVTTAATILRHARADLTAQAPGDAPYTLTTWDDDPSWAAVARGDSVRVEIDTYVYGRTDPTVFTGRVLKKVWRGRPGWRGLISWTVQPDRKDAA